MHLRLHVSCTCSHIYIKFMLYITFDIVFYIMGCDEMQCMPDSITSHAPPPFMYTHRKWTSICICLYLYSAHEKLNVCLYRVYIYYILLQLRQAYTPSNACMHEWKITTNVIKHCLLYHCYYCAPISKGQRFSHTCNLLVSSAVISVSWSTFSFIILYTKQNEGVI